MHGSKQLNRISQVDALRVAHELGAYEEQKIEQLEDEEVHVAQQQPLEEYDQVLECKLNDRQPLYLDPYELLLVLRFVGNQEEHEVKAYLSA